MSSRCFQLSVGNSGFVCPLALTRCPFKQEGKKTRISTVLRHLFLAVIQMGTQNYLDLARMQYALTPSNVTKQA